MTTRTRARALAVACLAAYYVLWAMGYAAMAAIVLRFLWIFLTDREVAVTVALLLVSLFTVIALEMGLDNVAAWARRMLNKDDR
jgi:H+/gluconate symporter-like permease